MIITTAFILWLIMLALVIQLTNPAKWAWTRLAVWAVLALLSLVLMLTHNLKFG